MYARPCVTVKRFVPVTVTPSVVAVTLRVVLAATGETVMLTVACVGLVASTSLTVTPGPKSNVVSSSKSVTRPTTVTSIVAPCAPDAGETNCNDCVVCWIVKPSRMLAVS